MHPNRASLAPAFLLIATLTLPVLTNAGEPAAGQDRNVQDLVARVDRYFETKWKTAGLQPASPAEDAEFLRRSYLDIVGRVPRVADVLHFLEDRQPNKRQRLVERLLTSPGYANHFANSWRAIWLADAKTNIFGRILTANFERWLRDRLAQNTPYDKMVREIVTAPIDQNASPFTDPNTRAVSPASFLLAREGKAENLAASASRLFLAMRLECAQCHDHPFASWKREQFWGMAAFFAGIQGQSQGEFVILTREQLERREIAIPGNDRVIPAVLPDGQEPRWRFNVSPRVTLADWLTAKDNPYFARAAVNRLWAHFFGYPLTDPVDDLAGTETRHHHPELLDLLAREFAAAGFDLKFLIRVLTSTRAYQLSSVTRNGNSASPYMFSTMAVKGLTGEQLFDSLATAVGYSVRQNGRENFFGSDGSPRGRFLEKFANRAEKSPESQTTILQALTLMNSRFVTDVTSGWQGNLLAAVIDAPFMNLETKIDRLYLAALTRLPRPEEKARALRFVIGVGKEGSAQASPSGPGRGHGPHGPHGGQPSEWTNLTDLFWALINSGEFVHNH